MWSRASKALAALGAVAQADFAEADLGDLWRNGARWAADRDRADFAVGRARVSREARVEARIDGNRELAGKLLYVGAH